MGFVMYIERIIQLAASLPSGSKASDDLSNALIKSLWDNLRHPPILYLGDEFKYRAADGSNNGGSAVQIKHSNL